MNISSVWMPCRPHLTLFLVVVGELLERMSLGLFCGRLALAVL